MIALARELPSAAIGGQYCSQNFQAASASRGNIRAGCDVPIRRVVIEKYRLFATCRYREPSGRARFPAHWKSAVRKRGSIERLVENQRPSIGPCGLVRVSGGSCVTIRTPAGSRSGGRRCNPAWIQGTNSGKRVLLSSVGQRFACVDRASDGCRSGQPRCLTHLVVHKSIESIRQFRCHIGDGRRNPTAAQRLCSKTSRPACSSFQQRPCRIKPLLHNQLEFARNG